MALPAPSPPRRISPSLWLFFWTFGIQLFVLIRFSQSNHFIPDGDDMKFYSDWAIRIAHGNWTDHKAFYGLPGYAYCLAGIFKLAGDNDLFTVGMIQSAMDASIAVLIYKLSLLIFRRPTLQDADPQLDAGSLVGILAALAWTFFTPAQAFATISMPTIWLVLAYYLCVWWAVKTESSSWWRPWLGLGVFMGVISMLVATILFAIPLMVAAIFRSVNAGRPLAIRAPKIAAAIVVLVSGLFLGASPAWMHNYFIAHEPVMLSAHGGINFWIGNNPTATGYPKMPPGIRATQEGLLRDSITLAEQAAGKKLTRAEVSRFWSAQADAYIHEHFFSWLRLMAIKFGNFWNSYQYDDLSIIKLLQDDGVVPPGLRFGFIAALGLAGAIPVLLGFPRAWWIVSAVFLHMCALMPVFVTERYRLAAVPGLMILGAGGLWVFWQNLLSARWKGLMPGILTFRLARWPSAAACHGAAERAIHPETLRLAQWPAAAAYVTLACGAGWFVSIPRADSSLWSLDYYKAGIRSTTAGDLDRAQWNLETAYAYVPNNDEINFALGNLWLAKSKRGTDDREKIRARENAKIYYRSALNLNPGHAGTLNNLGVMFKDEKRWDAAEWFFAHAIKAEPGDAARLYLLADVLLEQGKREEAQATLNEALKLRPQQKEFLELQEKLRNFTPPSADAQTPNLPKPALPLRTPQSEIRN